MRNTPRRLSASLVGLALVLPAAAEPPTPQVRRFDNGLTVVVTEDRTLPLVSVQLAIAAGTAADPPRRPGLAAIAARLLEHRDAAATRLAAAGTQPETVIGPDAIVFSAVVARGRDARTSHAEEHCSQSSGTRDGSNGARSASDGTRTGQAGPRHVTPAKAGVHVGHPPATVDSRLPRLREGDSGNDGGRVVPMAHARRVPLLCEQWSSPLAPEGPRMVATGGASTAARRATRNPWLAHHPTVSSTPAEHGRTSRQWHPGDRPHEQLAWVLRVQAERLTRQVVTLEQLAAARDAAARGEECRRTQRSDATEAAPAQDGQARRSDATEMAIAAALFDGHPYSRLPSFVSAEATAYTPADVQEFLDRWCVPGNATVFITGDVGVEDAVAAARAAFGDLPWREPPRAAYVPVPSAEPAPRPVRVRGPERRVLIAWTAPPAGYYENEALLVLLPYLVNPRDGALTAALAGRATARFDEPRFWRDAGQVTLELAPTGDATDGESLVRVVDDVLDRVAGEVPDETALPRARAQAGRALAVQRATLTGRAAALRACQLAGDIGQYERIPQRVENVTAGNLREAAVRLQRARRVVVFVGPEEPAYERPAALVAESVERLAPGEALRRLVEHSATPVGVTPAPPGRQETVHTADPTAPGDVTVWELPGASLAAVVMLAARGDAATTQPSDAAGGPGWSADELDDYLTFHGLTLERIEGGLLGTGPAERVPALLELQAAWLAAGESPGRVIVVGDVAAEDLRAVVAADLATSPKTSGTEARRYCTADRAASRPSPYPLPGREGAVVPQEPSPFLLPRGEGAVVAVRLTVPEGVATEHGAALAAGAWLLGRPAGVAAPLGPDAEWMWQDVTWDGRGWVAHVAAGCDAVGAARAFVARVGELRERGVAHDELALALRLERARRWRALDSSVAVALALARSPRPWDWAEPTAAEFAEALAAAAGGAITLEHVGADVEAATVAEVEQVIAGAGR